MTHISSPSQIETLFQALAERYNEPATIYLVGGGALMLLGSRRPTLDVDYVGIDIPGLWSDLQRSIDQLAKEMNLDIEAVPYEKMIPLSADFARRHILVGEYGLLRVFVFDPQALALGKLDRGSESDLEDICFLIQQDFITLVQLEQQMHEAILRAEQFDLNPKAMRKNLALVKEMLGVP